jgi:RNA polymerase sigma-70 factor (ECF subfamily)
VVAAVKNRPQSEIFPSGNQWHFWCLPWNKTALAPVYAIEVPDQPSAAATFEDLAVPLFDQLYNFAHWLTQERSEAEDLVQETYVKALRGFSGFQPGTNFRAWIFRILRNSFLTSRTALKLTTPLDDDVVETVASAQPTAETVLIEKGDRETVRNALSELPVPFREILLLCEVEEMSYEEIAQVLAIPIGTVMSRLHRARKALRVVLVAMFQGGSNGV